MAQFYSTVKQTVRPLVPAEFWRRLRNLSLRFRILAYKRSRVQHIYGGTPLNLEIGDQLAKDWYDRDWPELPEIRLLKQHSLKAGALIFDLGAHQGVVALMMSRIVGPNGKVIAVEANPHNAAAARRNFDLNKAQNCTIIQAAVAASPGKLTFCNALNGSVDEGNGQFGQFDAEAITVDEISSKYGTPDILFIDVEGFECRVLEGATKTLQFHPDLFVEVHSGAGLEKFGDSVERVLSFFQDPKYQLYFSKDDGTEFRRFETNQPLLRERFFLIAVYDR